VNFKEFINLPSSEKITLVTVDSAQEMKIFDNYLFEGSFLFVRDVDFFVASVRDSLFEYEKLDSIPVFDGGGRQFYFDAKNKKLYVKSPTILGPRENGLIVTNRHFYSTAPFILPNDLESGEPVEWLPLIEGIGSLGQQLDDENTGVVLESNSSLTLINSDGYFDEIYDTQIWENKTANFYLWSPIIPLSEKQRIFTGVVESKEFDDLKIVFKLKDFVFRLQGVLNQPSFSIDDGRISTSVVGKPKRRIYGRVQGLKCESMDKVLDGFESFGVITGVAGSLEVNGTGTNFLRDLTEGDKVTIIINDEEEDLTVDSVVSNTQFLVSQELEIGFTSTPFKFEPQTPYRYSNRKWSIAGHKLFSPQREILVVNSGNRFILGDVSGLFPDDQVTINGTRTRIRRISGNQVITTATVEPLPVAGDILEKKAIYSLYNKNGRFIEDRDYTLTNNSNDCFVTMDDKAEFNIARTRSLPYSFNFVSGTRTVTTTASVDLRTVLFPNNWIKQSSSLITNWYEILSVSETTITLRTNSLESGTGEIVFKALDVLQDDTFLLIDCMGIESNGQWLRTPADTAKHLLTYDAGFTDIDEEAFTKANGECDFIMSLYSPEDIGSNGEKIKDVLTKVNNSCFGSVFQGVDLNISFSILNSKKPSDESFIKDDDIISWTSSTTNQIINECDVNYRPFIDASTEQKAFLLKSYRSSFVDKLVGISKKDTRNIYLYSDLDAETIAQRVCLFNSLSLGRVTVNTKINLHDKNVNDKIFISLDRIFKRYGGRSRRKIGIISAVKKDGFGNSVTFNDLGNIFNRVPSIAPNTEPDYTGADDDSRARYGYVVDNMTLTPDSNSEAELGNNLIG